MADASKCVWCGDLKRHEAKLVELTDAGLTDDHPLVVATRRRICGAQAFDDREHGRTDSSA
jgi:hypothetical protein